MLQAEENWIELCRLAFMTDDTGNGSATSEFGLIVLRRVAQGRISTRS